MTVEKSQGRTLKRVILALSSRSSKSCQMDYSSLYVSLSRVRRREDMRLLLTGNTFSDQQMSLLYCESLKRNNAITAFFDGFQSTKEGQNRLDISWKRDAALESYVKQKTGRKPLHRTCLNLPRPNRSNLFHHQQSRQSQGAPGSLVMDLEWAPGHGRTREM